MPRTRELPDAAARSPNAIRRSAGWCGLSILCCASTALAAAPRLTNVLPHGGQRGTEVELVLVGNNLLDAQELLLYDEGLEVLSFEAPAPPPPPAAGDAERGGAREGRGRAGARGRGRGGRGGRGRGGAASPPQQVKVRIRIADDCPLGKQRLRIRTASGLSDLQNFFVGPLPVIEEQEPNTAFPDAQRIESNVTVHGRIVNEDADHFVLACHQGDRLSVEVVGMRLGTSSSDRFFDPALTVLNSARFELAASDDTVLGRNDGMLSLIIPEDGDYTIQLRDASYNGDERAYYLLHVGNFPRPTVAFPAGGVPGEELSVVWRGDAAGEFSQQFGLLDVLSQPRPEFALEVKSEQGPSPTPVPWRANSLTNFAEQEPNQNSNTAKVITPPAALNGAIGEGDIVDYFRFTAKQGDAWDIEVFAQRIGSPLDPVLRIVRIEGNQTVVSSDDTRGQDSYVRFQAPADGDYLIGVSDHLRSGGPHSVYRVEITPAQPRLNARVAEFNTYVAPQIIVPRGGAIGLLVNVEKQDVQGEVRIRSDDLPEGVRVISPEEWRGEGLIPMLFVADAEAPVAGKFANISAVLTDPARAEFSLATPVTQNVLMIRGPNNARILEEEMRRLPVVVTETAPFRLWLDVPPVPVVRGGTQELVVHCERSPGFAGRIDLRLLTDPPGCSAIKSLRIEPDATEARVPFHANVDAPLKAWPIAMRGITRIAGGEVEVCTDFVPMHVEERYVLMEFAKVAAVQGETLKYPVKVSKQRDFEGEAEATLVGLPAHVTAAPVKFTREATEIAFEIAIGGEAPVGESKNLQCEVRVPRDGQQMLHLLGRGQLRIDPAPVAKPETPAAPPADRPLSRLEQLRSQPAQSE